MKRVALALAVVLFAKPAVASTAVAASVEELARSSDAVVRGLVVGQQSRRTRDGLRIHTYVDVEVQDTWRGRAPPRLTVRVPGGVVDGIGQRVHGVAAFADGAEVVLFLKVSGSIYLVSGLAQGKFEVDGAIARHDRRGLALVKGTIPQGERLAEEMALSELERRVRGTR